MSRVLIALGGNALGKNNSEQRKAVKVTAKTIVDLFEKGYEIIVGHGNGPQVGMINNSFSEAHKNKIIDEVMPFAECVAMSQGYIGYHIQNAIDNELKKRKINSNVTTIITQVIVDEKSEAFNNPTKPIGSFMDETLAKKLAKENNWIVKEDSGKGWRRVVPSPLPIDIVEKDVIKTLANNNILIAGGGGGIPVYKKGHELIGIDAVIDKDFTSSKMAELVNADILMILTNVDQVMINFGKENEKSIESISVKELQEHITNGEFHDGSMKPKVQAAMNFVNNTNKIAYIANLENASKVLDGKSGTKIFK